MSQLDEDVLAKWVLSHTDMTLADMTRAKAYDKQAVYQLFSVATQIPLTWQTPSSVAQRDDFLELRRVAERRLWQTVAEHQGAPQPAGGT